MIGSTEFNGIDFVEVATEDQKNLHVHFLNAQVIVKGTISNVTIAGGETIPTVSVLDLEQINDNSHWMTDSAGRPIILKLSVDKPGDFSRYTLTLESSKLDPFFSQATFSFKINCPSDLDCATPPITCPPTDVDIPPIDYLAKDFLSFRKALSDFSALRYPDWMERSEADFGVMFLEALCALADDLSYTQDRIAAEASLDTATQRRSIVRHARLVDYEPRPATAARTWLQFDVTADSIPAGLRVSAQGANGETIDFEVGTGLRDDRTEYPVRPEWNRGIEPYYWDDSQQCLRAGATEMWIIGHGFDFQAGQALMIETQGRTSADPPIREIVHLRKSVEPEDETSDPLFDNQPVTQIFWKFEDAMQVDHDLTRTVLAGNLLPATQGRRYTETFTIPMEPTNPSSSISRSTPLALVRTGANHSPDTPSLQYLYPLRYGSLVWLNSDDPEALPLPEIEVEQQLAGRATPWVWRRKLLEADPFENAFTVDPVAYRRTVRLSDGSIMQDYDGDGGDTIRFGDGIFGELPNPGDEFRITYRVGGGPIGNVAADTITQIPPEAAGLVSRVTNPLAATGGADEESDERVRRLAPQAFRAKQFRAVRAKDYEDTAESLPWVQRAGTVFRWTGSWLTVFTTPDPKGREGLSVSQHLELIDLLNRRRLAGYESYVPPPRYVSLELEITVCAQPSAFRGDVKAAILQVLSSTKLPDGRTGFFYPNRWSFGQPLARSALEAAIQSAAGVAGVVSIRYRQRGVTIDYLLLPETVKIPVNAILQLANNPNAPERGTLRILVEGGK